MAELIRRNPFGYRIGEGHQNARLSDDEVRAMRFLHASAYALRVVKAGHGGVGGYGWLSDRFRCGESTARDICTFRTRRIA